MRFSLLPDHPCRRWETWSWRGCLYYSQGTDREEMKRQSGPAGRQGSQEGSLICQPQACPSPPRAVQRLGDRGDPRPSMDQLQGIIKPPRNMKYHDQVHFENKFLNLYSFPRASITNDHNPGDLKQQKCNLSQFWRLQVQSQGVVRAVVSSKAPGRTIPSLSVSFMVWSATTVSVAGSHTLVSTSVVTWPSPHVSASLLSLFSAH